MQTGDRDQDSEDVNPNEGLHEDLRQTSAPIPPASQPSSAIRRRHKSDRPTVQPLINTGSVSLNADQLKSIVEDGCKGLIESMEMRLMGQLKSLESHVKASENRLTFMYNAVQAIHKKLHLGDMPSVEIPPYSGPSGHGHGHDDETDPGSEVEGEDSPDLDEECVKMTNNMINTVVYGKSTQNDQTKGRLNAEEMDEHAETSNARDSNLHTEAPNVARDREGSPTKKKLHPTGEEGYAVEHDAVAALLEVGCILHKQTPYETPQATPLLKGEKFLILDINRVLAHIRTQHSKLTLIYTLFSFSLLPCVNE